jgi:hypothetical protein
VVKCKGVYNRRPRFRRTLARASAAAFPVFIWLQGRNGTVPCSFSPRLSSSYASSNPQILEFYPTAPAPQKFLPSLHPFTRWNSLTSPPCSRFGYLSGFISPTLLSFITYLAPEPAPLSNNPHFAESRHYILVFFSFEFSLWWPLKLNLFSLHSSLTGRKSSFPSLVAMFVGIDSMNHPPTLDS